MAKAPITIYVRSTRDSCVHHDTYDNRTCNRSRSSHDNGGVLSHAFEAGESDFVYPTDVERRKIYEQLKGEFDATD